MNRTHICQDGQYEKCGDKYPFNRVDMTHIDLSKSQNYEIFQIEARKLLCLERFDIFAFLIYISHREKKMDMTTAILIYKNIIAAESYGTFVETGKENKKNTFTDYIQSFESLIDSIREGGVNSDLTLIPIDKDNIIIDGLHRLSIAAYYNQVVTVIKFNDIVMTHITPEYLITKQVDINTIELMLLEYITWNTDLYMYIFWPKFFPLDIIKQSSSYNILSNNVKIIYKKKVKLSYHALRNLMLQLYMHMDWVGTIENHFASTYIKADEAWEKNGNVEFILVSSDSFDKTVRLKESIRDVCGIKLASVHSTDTYSEIYLVANLIYNTNSFHHIYYSFPDKFQDSFKLISSYKSLLAKNNISPEDYVIDSGMVLAIYGIRAADDLDYLTNSDSGDIINTKNIESHNAYIKYHNTTINNLLYNPNNYFIFGELKFLNLDRLYIFKQNRYRELKEKKDYQDIKLISCYQRKGWHFKVKLYIIQLGCILTRHCSNLQKFLRKFTIEMIIFLLKKLKIYNKMRSVYRKIRKKTGGKRQKNKIQFCKTSLQWNDILKQTPGYASEDILFRCRDALLKVKNGEFPYERDAVLFTEKTLFFPLLSALFYISLKKEKKLNLIDFGGSLGSTYYQNKNELNDTGIGINWKVVEQENFVKCGKDNFENTELRFYYTIDEALLWGGGADVCIFGSVLPYLENPYSILDQVYQKKIEYIIIDRTMFLNSADEDVLTIETVLEDIAKTVYPAWFLSLNKFLFYIKDKYKIVFQWNAAFQMSLPGYETIDKGFLLRRL
jgi:putative methyltransferase (TIGR04325 family)